MAEQGWITQGDLACVGGMSEPQSHTEHQAALDATLFRVSDDSDELVLELVAGTLRVRPSPNP